MTDNSRAESGARSGVERVWVSPGAPVEARGVAWSERAFRYGDGVFASLSARQGRLLDARAHIERLSTGCARIGLAVPEGLDDPREVASIAADLMAGSPGDGVLRIQASAGTSGRGYGREWDAHSWALIEWLPPPEPRQLRLAVQTSDIELPSPVMPGVKTCSALPLVIAALHARRRGVDDLVRLDDGRVTEASAANVFWWTGGKLCTPGDDQPLYPGVTRAVVIAAARSAGLDLDVGATDAESLKGAEAVFLTNSVRGVEHAHSLDGRTLDWPEELRRLASRVEHDRLEGSMEVPLDRVP